MTKRILALLLLAAMMLTCFVACKDNGDETGTTVAETETDAEPTEAPTDKESEPATAAPTEEPTAAPTEPATDPATEPADTEPAETEPADGIYDTDNEKAQFACLSFDECEAWKGDAELVKFFTPGQAASCAEITDIPGESTHLRIWGWLGLKAEYASVGYKIDDAAPVFNEEWLVEADPNVVGAAKGNGGDYATRYRIWPDLTELTSGEHTVKALYKLADGTMVNFVTVKINVGYRKPVLNDTAKSFTADAAAQAEGAAFNATDLNDFFTVELPTEGSKMAGGVYVLDGISDMYVDMDGTYSFYVNMLAAVQPGGNYVFVRGEKVVHSVDLPAPANGLCPINNYYETDGSEGNSCGGSGLLFSLNGGVLTVTVKYYDAESIVRIGNARFTAEVDSTEFLIVDDDDTVTVFCGKKEVVSIKLTGTADLADYAGLEIVTDSHFAKTAVLTFADGSVETVDNVLVRDTAASQIGMASRVGEVRFDKLSVKPLSDTAIPGMPVYIVGPDFLKAQYEGGTPATIQHSDIKMNNGYITFTSNNNDPYVAVVDLQSSVKAAQYVAVKYRTTGTVGGQFFIGSAGGWTGNGDFINYPYVNDGEWNLLVVDTTQSQAVTDVNVCGYCRYDYFQGNGGSIDVAWIGFFPSEEDAQIYFAKSMIEPEQPAVELPAADILNAVVTDDGLVDLSGNGYTVTKIGEVPVQDFGFIKGLMFNRSGNYKIEGIDYAKIEDGFTMEIAFMTGDMSAYECICSNFHAGGYGFDIDGGNMCMNVHVNGTYVGAGLKLEKNTMYHAIGVWDGSVCSLYINGELVSQTDAATALDLPTDPGARYLCVGGDSSADGNGESLFGGVIAGVRIYDQPVTAEQAALIFSTTIAQ